MDLDELIDAPVPDLDERAVRSRVEARVRQLRSVRARRRRLIAASAAVSAVGLVSIASWQRSQRPETIRATGHGRAVETTVVDLPPCSPIPAPGVHDAGVVVELRLERDGSGDLHGTVRVTNSGPGPISINTDPGVPVFGLDGHGAVVLDDHPASRTSMIETVDEGATLTSPANVGTAPCGDGSAPVAYVAVVWGTRGDHGIEAVSSPVPGS